MDTDGTQAVLGDPLHLGSRPTTTSGPPPSHLEFAQWTLRRSHDSLSYQDRHIDISLLTLCTSDAIGSYHSRAEASTAPHVPFSPTGSSAGRFPRKLLKFKMKRRPKRHRPVRSPFPVSQKPISQFEISVFYCLGISLGASTAARTAGVEWTVAVGGARISSHCDSVAMVQRDSVSGEPMFLQNHRRSPVLTWLSRSPLLSWPLYTQARSDCELFLDCRAAWQAVRRSSQPTDRHRSRRYRQPSV